MFTSFVCASSQISRARRLVSPSNHERFVIFLDFSSSRKSNVARPHKRLGNVTNETIFSFMASSESGSAPSAKAPAHTAAPNTEKTTLLIMSIPPLWLFHSPSTSGKGCAAFISRLVIGEKYSTSCIVGRLADNPFCATASLFELMMYIGYSFNSKESKSIAREGNSRLEYNIRALSCTPLV